jgi:hypothetical protein
MRKRAADDPSTKKSEVVTIRLDPRLKYLAELGARKQRRTLSSYIESAVEKSLYNVMISDDPRYEQFSVAEADRKYNLWGLSESDRMIRLALKFPELLTHEEQRIWKLVRYNGYFWRGRYEGNPREYSWRVDEKSMLWPRLRESWAIIRAVANETKSEADMPKWKRFPDASDDESV